MKTWPILALLALVLLGIGVGTALGFLRVDDLDPALWVVSAVFAGTGLLLAAWLPGVIREQATGEAGLVPVPPATEPAADRAVPWSLGEVAGELARVLEETPYVVTANDRRIRVSVDLADATFLGALSLRDVEVVQSLDVVARRQGRAALVDARREVDRTLRPDGTAGLAYTGRTTVQSGRTWSVERRVEWGVGADGRWGRQVDYRFSSAEMRAPVVAVLERGGWRSVMSTEVKGALVMAALGASAVPIVGILALTGNLD